ncbi:MAG: hypothetical protein M3463_05925 [Verrucomicrobiota bacterium]|nr:hypothetical protein [Verrucomicrobiota bacterium]
MKKVLSLLVAFVFLQTQSWAISGGPFSGGNTTVSTIGTYSGVLAGPLNALGIFTIGVPSVGVATGDFVMFANGSYYTGTITGIADPAKAALQAVVNGQRLNTSFTGTDLFGRPVTFTNADARTDGFINAKIGTFGGLGTTRLRGTAQVEVKELLPAPVLDGAGNPVLDSAGNPVIRTQFVTVATLSLQVDGFRQSSTAPTQGLGGLGRPGTPGRGGTGRG